MMSSGLCMLAMAVVTVTIAVCQSEVNQTKVNAGEAPAIEIPAGYRNWQLVSVAREEGKLQDLRAMLGNSTAIAAYREQSQPFPDGSIIARLAWEYKPLEESSQAFGSPQSSVAGAQKNGVQFMIKDASKYASTGGWGFAQFNNGEPTNVAVQQKCFSCHQIVKGRDLVFTRYTP